MAASWRRLRSIRSKLGRVLALLLRLTFCDGCQLSYLREAELELQVKRLKLGNEAKTRDAIALEALTREKSRAYQLSP